MNGFITQRNINTKFQLVHLGKLPKNQLARSQNRLVMDERTSVKIFNAFACHFCYIFDQQKGPKTGCYDTPFKTLNRPHVTHSFTIDLELAKIDKN